MTIMIAWVRRNKEARELLLASDSRLRSRGAMNQCQKLFPLERGDCCIGFCGDAQVAYPLVTQLGSTLNNFIKTRTGGADVTNLIDTVRIILNGLVDSWDLDPGGKIDELRETKIVLAGWSWRFQRFEIGTFIYRDHQFNYHHQKQNLQHPWKEAHQSLVFVGDYNQEYMTALTLILERRHGEHSSSKNKKKVVNFDYEPIEALSLLLDKPTDSTSYPLIGGTAQLAKIYPYGRTLPIVIRAKNNEHFFFGRKLAIWEKTGFPILDINDSTPKIFYPLASVPLPSALTQGIDITGDSDSEPTILSIPNQSGI